MERMFQDCKTLISLDVSNFDTSNVERMALMFCECESLTELDLSSFDTSKAGTNGSHAYLSMFCFCRNLRKLNISNFDTDKYSYHFMHMFYDCDPNIIPPKFQKKL